MKPGIYRHYKGQHYFLFQIVTHSETGESLACYRCLYGDFSWWVRPLPMFKESVTIADEIIPRFQLVRELSQLEQLEYLASCDALSSRLSSQANIE